MRKQYPKGIPWQKSVAKAQPCQSDLPNGQAMEEKTARKIVGNKYFILSPSTASGRQTEGRGWLIIKGRKGMFM